MGLSVAIAGGIVMVTIMLVMLTIPTVVTNIFSIDEVSSKSSKVDDSVSKTKISIQELTTLIGSPRVNFTLNNEGSTILWNFNKFNVLVEYTGAVSGKRTEQLSLIGNPDGECLGAVPPAGQWCIQSILNDVADPQLLNSDEQARIRTRLNEILTSNSAIVTVATDNGVSYTTGGPQCQSGLLLPSCYKFGTFQPISTTLQGDGLLGLNSLPGALDTFNDDVDGIRLVAQTGFPANSDNGFFGSVALYHREWDSYLDARIQVTNTTNSRYQIGFSSETLVDGGDGLCNNDSCASVMIRSGDTTYQYVVNDGDAAQDVTNSGIAESTGVVRVQVRFDSANNRVGFTINDNPETFISAEIPAAATDLFPIVVQENSVGNQRQSIEIYYVYTSEKK